jgi:hypothetical protein
MLDYLYHSAINYQKQHGIMPNLIYLNGQHLQSVQIQLQKHHELANLLNTFKIKIVLSPTLSHPSFASI